MMIFQHPCRSAISIKLQSMGVMRCAIWYHLHNLKNVQKHPWRSAITLLHGRFFTFLKLYKCNAYLGLQNSTMESFATTVKGFKALHLIYSWVSWLHV